MISSLDEFLLLLNKWKSESSLVTLIGTITNTVGGENRLLAVSHVRGTVRNIDTKDMAFMLSDENRSYAIIDFSECQFHYGPLDSEPKIAGFEQFMGDQYEDAVALEFPTGDVLTLMSVKNE